MGNGNFEGLGHCLDNMEVMQCPRAVSSYYGK